MKVQFREWTCTIQFSLYVDGGGLALQLVDHETGEPIARATVNLDGLAKDEIAIKDYSENEGMLDALLAVGLIEQPHRFETSGFVSIPVTRLKGT